MCRMQKITQVSCSGNDRVEPESTPGVPSIPLRATDRKDGADLFERILERNNLNRAYKQVKRNGGAPGIDGMTIDKLLEYLHEHKESFLESLRNGTYRPLPKHWSSHGHRIQISPEKAAAEDLFVQVIQLCPEGDAPPKIDSCMDGDTLQIAMDGRAAVLNAGGRFFSGSVSWDLPAGEWLLTVTDLAPGTWRLENSNRVFTVEEGKNMAVLTVAGGKNSLKQIRQK